MKLKMWQVDAFARKPFEGNPAAIVHLQKWLPDSQLRAIATENNLSETAFFVEQHTGTYKLRWFTPVSEVTLCGHGTLATGWLILHELAPDLETVHFETKSGILSVERGENGMLRMTLPADPQIPFVGKSSFSSELGEELGVAPPKEILSGRYLMAIWDDEDVIRAISPKNDFVSLLRSVDMWGVIVTGKGHGDPYDCVSRFFAPDKGVFEDPVTGSAHCAIISYWAKVLGKKTLRAFQASPRGGDLICTDHGTNVVLSGACALYLTGEIEV